MKYRPVAQSPRRSNGRQRFGKRSRSKHILKKSGLFVGIVAVCGLVVGGGYVALGQVGSLWMTGNYEMGAAAPTPSAKSQQTFVESSGKSTGGSAVGSTSGNLKGADEKKSYTFSVMTRGNVRISQGEFAREAERILNDKRGWGGQGDFGFEQVASGGDFTLWLSEAKSVPFFSEGCSSAWSCRVGRDVIINDTRWMNGSSLGLPIATYRHLVINHEVGHWLGLSDASCPGAGEQANVMQQQSKGGTSLGKCKPNAWPRAEEIQLARQTAPAGSRVR